MKRTETEHPIRPKLGLLILPCSNHCHSNRWSSWSGVSWISHIRQIRKGDPGIPELLGEVNNIFCVGLWVMIFPHQLKVKYSNISQIQFKIDWNKEQRTWVLGTKSVPQLDGMEIRACLDTNGKLAQMHSTWWPSHAKESHAKTYSSPDMDNSLQNEILCTMQLPLKSPHHKQTISNNIASKVGCRLAEPTI